VSVRAFGTPSALDERVYVELREPDSVALSALKATKTEAESKGQ
jgi:hypothetical protein